MAFRQLFSLLTFLALAMPLISASAIAKPHPTDCNTRVTRALPAFENGEKQTLVVESFGTCADPLVLVWIDQPHDRVEDLHFARLSAYRMRARSPAKVATAVKAILSQIKTRRTSDFETWQRLQAAGDSPGGGSWRGTPLSKPDYERITSSAILILLIPTDSGRAKLVAWDASVEEWVDVVYYGD